MKKTLSISTLLLLFVLSISAATPQQPISAEKKSAMHKLDPVDIFPQAQERSGKDRNRNNRPSNSASADLTTNNSLKAERASSRRNSRRRQSEERLPANLAANANPTPTPATGAQNTQAEPTTAASPAGMPNSSGVIGETASNKAAPPPQTLAAIGNLPESNAGNRNSVLSLPIILAMLVLILIVLVFVFAKLIRYLRGPVV